MTIAKYSISWLKRFIDNDTRYEQFLCPRAERLGDPGVPGHLPALGLTR